MLEYYYHVSPIKYRKSILENGLVPKNGPRSKAMKEHEDKIYLVKVPAFITMIRRFMLHPDFTEGYDIWRVLVNKDNLREDVMLQGGRYLTNPIRGVLCESSVVNKHLEELKNIHDTVNE